MYFTKIPHVANFEFGTAYDAAKHALKIGKRSLDFEINEYSGDIWHIAASHPELWTERHCLLDMNTPEAGKGHAKLAFDAKGHLVLTNPTGQVLLEGGPEGTLGIMDRASMFSFTYHKEYQFYGMGEKTFGTLELTHKRSRFWNVDALGDFPMAQWDNQALDPYYVSVPYLIVRVGEEYIGLLYDNPYATFMDCGSDASFYGDQDENRRIVIGSEDGLPSLWVIYGPSLAELTCKLQKLVGTHQLPPLWALGYHQCQWGYKGEADLVRLDAKLTEHSIPNDGLWLDIDYMTGFRVFTYAQDHFPKGVAAAVKKVAKHNRKVVPIIDPGVKLDPDYEVYQSGMKKDIFCKNPQGKEYVGFVWPGLTVFPDFSLTETRKWWKGYAESFRKEGFHGAWLDMNDPSTGAIDPMAMLFNRGSLPHAAHRNQYALGMQWATHEGFQAAEPDERVFLLSRSGFTGTSRFSAIWTGDNVSSRWYLRNAITCTVGLAISGIPFNGPDVGGFFGNTNEPLMEDWVKMGFLFPFFRIHSPGNFRHQEPWTFSKKALQTIRHHIRLRYKLIPYLYNQFVAHDRDGHPMIRPVLYHYSEKKASDDQFLIGDAILQAPHLEEGQGRVAVLPGRAPWFCASSGQWLAPGKHTLSRETTPNPVYFRNGALIPCLPGERTDNAKDLSKVEVHVFIAKGSASATYVADDGQSLDYRKGKQSEVSLHAQVKGQSLYLSHETVQNGYGAVEMEFVVYGTFKAIYINNEKVRGVKGKQAWTGKAIPVTVVK